MTPLTLEIQQAAQTLGETLQSDPNVREYLGAKARFEADAEATALEDELYHTYDTLIARQQIGETLDRAEVDAFNELRRSYYDHPLVPEREGKLNAAKPFLASVADELTGALGVDFIALAKEH